VNKSDRASFAVFILACLSLAFVAGLFVAIAQVFPYRHANDAYLAANALIGQSSIKNPYTQTNLWRRARTDKRGMTIHDSERAHSGYTLYTSGDGAYASLVDMRGREVHRWELPFSSVWKTAPHGGEPRPDKFIYWRKAVMYPNGDLLVNYVAEGDTPWGYGLAKLGADSSVIWSYKEATHHDIDLASDGRVIALTHAFSNKKFPAFQALANSWLEDSLVVLNGKTGEELHNISLFEAYYHSPFRPMHLAIPGFALWDPLHANSVQHIDKALARNFAPARGQHNKVLVSFRQPGTLALIDLNNGKMTWGLKGPWLGQHTARALSNGRFTVFDNYGNFDDGNTSRILEVDPENGAIVWSYSGNPAQPFESKLRGAITTLPNGNRLVTESDGGRLFEVTPDKQIVWEFINPVRGGDQNQFIPVVSSGQRFSRDDLHPDFLAQFRR